jgi:hypothetical protein
MNFPKPVTAGDVYNNDPVAATDTTNHLVLPIYEVNPNDGDTANSTNGTFLVSYTADSKGNLTTTNTLRRCANVRVGMGNSQR